MSDKSIAIVTTVNNWDLYGKTSKSFPMEVDIYAVDGSDRFYGLRSLMFVLKKFKKTSYKWLLLVDEDAVFSSTTELYSLIRYMEAEKITACGMRDGGEIKWRNFSPYSINTFFCIINLEKIYKVFNSKEIIDNQYILKDEFSYQIPNLKYSNYRKDSLFEEYYCFFFWLLRKNKKIFYLEATNPFHDETTALKNHKNEVFLYHAWYSRFYGKDKVHTERINKMIDLGQKTNNTVSPVLLKNIPYKLKFLVYKYYRRFLRKLR